MPPMIGAVWKAGVCTAKNEGSKLEGGVTKANWLEYAPR